MKGGNCRLGPSWALGALFIPVTLLVLTSRGALSGRKMAQMAMAQATDTAAGPGSGPADGLPGLRAVADFVASEKAHVWLLSVAGSVAVGLSGIFPLLVIPVDAGIALKTEAGGHKLKQLLSFAIGGLLGDVFLHLLPEAWALSGARDKLNHYVTQGLWVIVGLLTFLLLEKMFPDQDVHDAPSPNSDVNFNTPMSTNSVSLASLTNGLRAESWKTSKQQQQQQEGSTKIKTSGYLNLLANCCDNFTHGLAVAGSFLVSKKENSSKCVETLMIEQDVAVPGGGGGANTVLIREVGCLTTFAILLHEIPHEVGDFAILLRAGFDRWSAALMQLLTALFGILGTCFVLLTQSPRGTENTTPWILPFTSGGFLYIALVNVVPDLLQETSLRQTVLQILLIVCGVAVMALLSAIVD